MIGPAPRERLQLVVTGHVDHGKSSVVGRLLADTGALPDGKLDQVRALCARTARPFEYAFLLDALREERAQGITIDAARIFFSSARREYLVLDAPGHVEFVRNMVTGAARADAALLVVDALDGLQENSRRHGHLLGLLGIPQVAVLVNKMDLVDYREEAFTRVAETCRRFLHDVGVAVAAILPVSARSGATLVRHDPAMSWYGGPTLLDLLDGFALAPADADAPLRLPVQDVYKFTAQGDARRIIAGSIASGTLRAGDPVAFHPSGLRSRVRTLEHAPAPGHVAGPGDAVGVTLDDPLFVVRGEVLTRADEAPPQVGDRLHASLFWLGTEPLRTGDAVMLRLGHARRHARVLRFERVFDAAALGAAHDLSAVGRNEIADAVLQLDRPLACDPAGTLAATGRFVLVRDHRIEGGGLVRQVGSATPAAANADAPVLWLTGLPGAGKTTIAARVVERLRDRGVAVEHLDGDALRTLFPSTGFSPTDRDEHVRRVGWLASRLAHHGVTVVASLISPQRAARAAVRALCPHFVEVHVATPLGECERRDVKGHYARARRGELADFTGVSAPYEAPAAPDLRLDTTGLTIETAAELVLARLIPSAEI